MLGFVSGVFKVALSAGSRHTSNESARLMELGGVMELCQEVRYARDIARWAVDMVSGDVVGVKSQVAE